MRHRYAWWTSALALVLVGAGAGCSDDSTGSNAGPIVNGPPATTGGTAALPVGGTMAGTAALPTGGMAAGTMAPPTAGTMMSQPPTGGMMAGTMEPPAGGTMAGMMEDPTGGMNAGTTPTGSGSCVPATAAGEDGPFTPTHIEGVGPGGQSWVFYPEELGKDGMLHPVFNWGPGAGTGPSQYTDHLNRIASHGFVVISQSSARGEETAALDWILAKNDEEGSEFYQKLDPSRVGMGGHSMGSLQTMANADDPRLNLYILVCGGCFSSGCGAADIHGPTIILGGDSDIGTPNFETDYSEITAPVTFVIKDGTDHIACARNNLSPWVAFMRWQWCGEEQWGTEFMSGGEYCTTPWECKSKNF